MSGICELEDLNKDCCVNCFNGLPAYGCPKQEEESKKLRELVHKKAMARDTKVRSDAIEEILQIVHNIYTQDLYCKADMCEKEIKGYSCEDCLYRSIKQNLEQLKEQRDA